MKVNIPQGFGVIVICMKSDLLFVKGCCESIRFFLGDVPICLLKDGSFNTKELEECYNVVTIEKGNIKNPFLRENSFGWGITRMIAFWESPFKSFLLLDSDTCLWGDMTEKIELLNTYDLVIDHKVENYSLAGINKFFFKTDSLSKIDPDFKFEGLPFCNPAVLLAHKDIFDIEDYKSVIEWTKKYPDLFKFGDMGFFNYLIFTYKEKGRMKIRQERLQEFVTDLTAEELAKNFHIGQLKENEKIGNPTVLHYCGASKPVVVNRQGFNTDIFTFFRERFYEKDKAVKNIKKKLEREDKKWEINEKLKYYKRRIKRIFKPLAV